MNILYLLKVLGTDKLSELVAAIDVPPLDMNLAIWDAIDRGEIEVDEDKDRIKALKDAAPTADPNLMNKLIRVIQHYAANEVNINKGRLISYMKDPVSNQGYATHDYLMAMQYLVDNGTLIEQIVTVPEVKKSRPFRRFVFLCLPENEANNEEWNAKAVNNWIANWEKKK